MLYFFLSYVHGDDDSYVRRFHEDLCQEVRMRTGVRQDEDVGFLDMRMEAGTYWPEELVSALSTCRVFLPLYTPGYFLSEACGKEWTAFEERLRSYERVRGRRPPALIPIVWFPLKELHPVAASIQ